MILFMENVSMLGGALLILTSEQNGSIWMHDARADRA
jgi:hypothetical protein